MLLCCNEIPHFREKMHEIKWRLVVTRENLEIISECKILLHNGFLKPTKKRLSAKVTSSPLMRDSSRILKTCVSSKPEKWRAVITISSRLMAVYLGLGYLQVDGKLNFKLP